MRLELALRAGMNNAAGVPQPSILDSVAAPPGLPQDSLRKTSKVGTFVLVVAVMEKATTAKRMDDNDDATFEKRCIHSPVE